MRYRRSVLASALLAACRPAADSSADGSGTVVFNADADSGVLGPTLVVEVPRPGRNEISMLRFTPDGRWMLALDATILVWEFDGRAGTLRERGWFGLAVDRDEPDVGPITPENAFAIQDKLGEWKKTHEGVEDFELLPGGRLVACGDDGTLALWRLQLGQQPPAERIATTRDVGKCSGLAVSADGLRVATFAHPTDAQRAEAPEPDDGAWQGLVQLWAIDDGQPPRSTARVLLDDRPSEGVFTPDGRHLLVIGSSQTFEVLAIDERGGARRLPETPMDSTLGDLAWVPGREGTLLTAGMDHTVGRWRVTGDGAGVSLAFEGAYHHHRAKVRDVVPSPDGRFAVASSPDRTISIWPLGHADDEVPTPVVFSAAADYVHAIDLHPVGPYLATGGEELKIWRIDRGLLAAGAGTRRRVQTRAWDAAPVTTTVRDVAWIDETSLRTTDVEGRTRGFTIVGDALVAGTESAPAAEAATATRSAIGECAVGVTETGRVGIWRTTGVPAVVGDVDLGLARLTIVRPTPDGSRVLVAGSDAEHRGKIALVAFDRTTCSLDASAALDPLPNTPSGDVLSQTSHPGGGGAAPRAAAFTADGRWLATADGEGAGALLWEVGDHGALHHRGELLGHHAGADAIAFAPDGRHVLTAGSDGEVLLHRVTLGADAAQIGGHAYLTPPRRPAWVSLGAAWSPSGRRVAVVGGWSSHGHVWVFEIDPTREQP
jgi:WD40 repeat protein